MHSLLLICHWLDWLTCEWLSSYLHSSSFLLLTICFPFFVELQLSCGSSARCSVRVWFAPKLSFISCLVPSVSLGLSCLCLCLLLFAFQFEAGSIINRVVTHSVWSKFSRSAVTHSVSSYSWLWILNISLPPPPQQHTPLQFTHFALQSN